MGTITLPNFRTPADATMNTRLKDGGVFIDWASLTDIKAWLYSDAQKAIAGRCDVTISQANSTKLVCVYSASKPQYLGVQRLIVQARYMGQTKTYDKPAFTFVRWTAEQAGEQITIDDPVVDVEIVVEDVTSSILDNIIAAALDAAARAEAAAQEAEHMVDIHTGPQGKSAYQVAVEDGFEGTEEEWLASLVGPAGESAYQLAVEQGYEGTLDEWLASLKGKDGIDGKDGMDGKDGIDGQDGVGIDDVEQTVTSRENGGVNNVRITLTDGTHYDVQIRNGKSSAGLFPTAAALSAACPSPPVGDYAFVGSNFPADIYVCQTAGTWTDSGEDYDGDSVDLTDLATKSEVSQLEAKVADLNTEIGFQERNYEPNKAITDTSATPQDAEGWGVSEFIPYTQGNDVVWRYADNETGGLNSIRFYDSGKNGIDGAYWTAKNASGTRTITVLEITLYAANAAYFRASFKMNYNSAGVVSGSDEWTPRAGASGMRSIITALGARVGGLEQGQQTLSSDVSGIKGDISNINGEIEGIKYGTAKNYEEGKYYSHSSQNGLYITNDANWGITGFVPYIPGKSVEWRWGSSRQSEKHLGFFNSNKEFINSAYWGANNNLGVLTISAASINLYAPNAAYVRASFLLNETNAHIKVGDDTLWANKEIGLATLDARLTAVEKNGGGGSDALTLNIFKRSAIDSIAVYIGSQAPKKKNNYFCILHQSDLHGDVTRMARMIAFANANNNISAIIETGDCAAENWSDTGFEDTYGAYYNKASVPVLPVIGNHEVGPYRTIQANSNQAVGARFISPYISSFGGVQGGTDAGYYYRDFATQKIRIIVVNEFEMPRIPNDGNTALKYGIWGRYFSQAQADWLVSTLNSVPADYSVIIAMHQPIDVFAKYENEFKGAVDYSDSNGDVAFAQRELLQNVVDAYISKTTLSKTYFVPGADVTEIPSVSVNADFTNANGEFVCYLNGHTHNDGTGQSSVATHKQVNINVTTGSANTNIRAVYDDLFRVDGTISQDAFNMVAIDTDKKEIRILRIGANVSADMRRRDYACISYAQE